MIQPWSVLNTRRSVTLLKSGKRFREITDLSSIFAEYRKYRACTKVASEPFFSVANNLGDSVAFNLESDSCYNAAATMF